RALRLHQGIEHELHRALGVAIDVDRVAGLTDRELVDVDPHPQWRCPGLTRSSPLRRPLHRHGGVTRAGRRVFAGMESEHGHEAWDAQVFDAAAKALDLAHEDLERVPGRGGDAPWALTAEFRAQECESPPLPTHPQGERDAVGPRRRGCLMS